MLCAVAAARRWADVGIELNALHPGAIADSNLSRHYDPAVLQDLRASGRYTFKTPEQGAATSGYVATSPLLHGVVGRPAPKMPASRPMPSTPTPPSTSGPSPRP